MAALLSSNCTSDPLGADIESAATNIESIRLRLFSPTDPVSAERDSKFDDQFSSKGIAQFARAVLQTKLDPQVIEAAFSLITSLEPSKRYSYSAICLGLSMEIERPLTGKPILGSVWQRDLPVLIDLLSQRVNLPIEKVPGPVVSAATLSGALAVSPEMLLIWREHGLVGLEAEHETGARERFYRLSEVRQFCSTSLIKLSKANAYDQLSTEQKEQIVGTFQQLAGSEEKESDVVLKVAEATKFAPELVKQVIEHWREMEHLAQLSVEDSKQDHLDIWGDLVPSIRSADNPLPSDKIKLLIERWQALPIAWVHSGLFDLSVADAIILDPPEPDSSRRRRKASVDNETGEERKPLLTAAQEQHLFSRYNYLKCSAWRDIATIEADEATWDDVKSIYDRLVAAKSLQARIAQENMGLAPSIAAKNFGGYPGSHDDLASDGNMALLRTIEKFDYSTGYKFSTYACNAMIKADLRFLDHRGNPKNTKQVANGETILNGAAGRSDNHGQNESMAMLREDLQDSYEFLEDVEIKVLSLRFPQSSDVERMTLEDIGREIGVSKERVRQIQERGLAKLRILLAPSLADTFDGDAEKLRESALRILHSPRSKKSA